MESQTNVRVFLGIMIGLAVLMIMTLGLHWFGPTVLTYAKYEQLFGALLGGLITLIVVNTPIRLGETSEPWLGNERLAWTLIGCGSVMWGLGECVYRYLLANNLPNFPALSDVGYASLPPLMFLGLMLQPDSGAGRGRLLVILDSLISMGSILAIAWFLLLGSLAMAPAESNLAKFLGLYYPVTDMALLSCVIFLILRGQGRVYETGARRLGLLLFGIGICVFAVSDFNYNIQNNMNAYIDGTWADLGWPLGLMLVGVGAYLRRFLPTTAQDLVEERVRGREERVGFSLPQLLPYVLLFTLFIVLVINVLSSDPAQVWIRPVLLAATLCVVCLVVARQVITQVDNERLTRRQEVSLSRLAEANARVEEQARLIATRNLSLEEGIAHLKTVQAQLANGNLRARARITGGDLVSLSGSFNLMAERLSRYEQIDSRSQKLTRALNEFSHALETYRVSGRFLLPPGCSDFPEVQRLLLALGLKQTSASSDFREPHTPLPPLERPGSNPLAGTGGNSRPLTGAGNTGSKPLAGTGNTTSQPLTGTGNISRKSLSGTGNTASQPLTGARNADSPAFPGQRRFPNSSLMPLDQGPAARPARKTFPSKSGEMIENPSAETSRNAFWPPEE